MAKYLSAYLEKGFLDNRASGKVRGKLWFSGMLDPVELFLDGDCWSDIAGRKICFERNKNSKPEILSEPLLPSCFGEIGDATTRWEVKFRNEICRALHFEWFSQNERYVVETNKMKIWHQGDQIWKMDKNQEQAQLALNDQMMREYVCHKLESFRGFRSNNPQLVNSVSLDEWVTTQINGCDLIAEMYREVLEKYENQKESELREAVAMGWDKMVGIMMGEILEEDELSEADPEDEIQLVSSVSVDLELMEKNAPNFVLRILKIAVEARQMLESRMHSFNELHCHETEFLSGMYFVAIKIQLVLASQPVDEVAQMIQTVHLRSARIGMKKVMKLWALIGENGVLEEVNFSRIAIELRSVSQRINAFGGVPL